MSPAKKSGPVSDGRKKMTAMGVQLPVLPTTTTGSFPKTSELSEFRYKVAQGVLAPSELLRKERIATEIWLREQTKAGFSVFVDGEMDRGDFIGFFANKIEGFESGGRVRIYGNRYYRKPIIKAKIAWKGPLIVESWQMSQRATHTPLKAVITGPYTLMDFSFNEYYSSREDIVRDLTAVIRKEIVALSEAGAKFIQIDEPALTTHPEEFSLISDSLKELTKGLRPYFILHHSYGEVAPLWQKIEKLPVHNFSFEAANSGMAVLKSLKSHPTDKDVTIGIIDPTIPEVESPKVVTDRIKASLKVIPASQLWFSADSGLKTLSTETAVEKMDVLSKSVAKARAAL